MTKHLKCIGGPWNGRTVAIEDGRRHFVVRENVTPILKGRSFQDAQPDSVQYREHLYVLDMVSIADGDCIEYLRPSEWDGERALRFALGPTC